MQFRLLYAGNLLKAAGARNRRAWEKHSIRRELHAQLNTLWKSNPALKYYSERSVEDPRGSPHQAFMDVLARRYARDGVGFVPLITAANGLVCELDIMFLRPERPGSILGQGGDIDNRVKVLLDGLRIPRSGSEMRRKEGDDPDPNPMYCLLEDDNLITSLKVTTDTLLFTLGKGPSEACVLITVNTANVDPFGSPWELHL
jgi:hypothetical protein